MKNTNAGRSTYYIRFLYELLFSVHLAVLVVARQDGLGWPVFCEQHPAPFRSLDQLLAPVCHSIMHSQNRLHTFLGLWWLMAVIILACVLVLGRIPFVRAVVCPVAGVGTVLGPPFCYFFMTVEGHLTTGVLLKVETAVIVACVLIYLYRRWPVNAALGVLILLLHYGLWGIVIFSPEHMRGFLWQMAAVLILPLCTSLVWGLYIKQSAGFGPPAVPHVT